MAIYPIICHCISPPPHFSNMDAVSIHESSWDVQSRGQGGSSASWRFGHVVVRLGGRGGSKIRKFMKKTTTKKKAQTNWLTIKYPTLGYKKPKINSEV